MFGVALAGAFAALMGLASIFSRRGLERESFEVLLLASLGVAAPVFAVGAGITTGFAQVPLEAVVLVGTAGFVGSFVGRICYIEGIRLVGPGKALTLIGVSPLLATGLAAVFLGETVGLSAWVGVAVIVVGIAGLARDTRAQLALGERSPRVLAVPAAATVLLAVAVTLRKEALTLGLAPVEAATVNMSVGLVAASGLFAARRGRRPAVDPVALRQFLVASLLMTVAFGCYFVGLSLTPAHVFYPLVQTQPLFAVAFSALLLGDLEVVTPRTVLGAGVLVAGVGLVTVGSAL